MSKGFVNQQWLQQQVCAAAEPQTSNSARPVTYGISLEKALNAAANVKVLVSMVAPSPIIATAPKGRGFVMIPTMVPRNMARRCHAGMVTPEGGGTNHTATASPTEMPKFFMSAPHLNSVGPVDAAAAATCPLLALQRDGEPRLAIFRESSGSFNPRPPT